MTSQDLFLENDVMTSSEEEEVAHAQEEGSKVKSRDDRPSPFNTFNGKKDKSIYMKKCSMFTVQM